MHFTSIFPASLQYLWPKQKRAVPVAPATPQQPSTQFVLCKTTKVIYNRSTKFSCFFFIRNIYWHANRACVDRLSHQPIKAEKLTSIRSLEKTAERTGCRNVQIKFQIKHRITKIPTAPRKQLSQRHMRFTWQNTDRLKIIKKHSNKRS